MTKNSNDLKTLDEIKTNNIITKLIYDKNPDKQVRMIALYQTDHSVQTIAELNGCSESNIYKTFRKYREKPIFREKVDKFIDEVVGELPERYKASRKLRLARIANIEDAALTKFEEDPEKAIDKPTLLRQMKISAGVLEGDEPKPTVIKISQLNLMANMISADIQEVIGGNRIDADAIDIKVEPAKLIEGE